VSPKIYHTKFYALATTYHGLTDKDMKTQKRLYDATKWSNSDTDWNAYQNMKNLLQSKLKETHNNYF